LVLRREPFKAQYDGSRLFTRTFAKTFAKTFAQTFGTTFAKTRILERAEAESINPMRHFQSTGPYS
jgi:hypothetical protein